MVVQTCSCITCFIILFEHFFVVFFCNLIRIVLLVLASVIFIPAIQLICLLLPRMVCAPSVLSLRKTRRYFRIGLTR